MLHTKFQGQQLFGSREEDFFTVFTMYGHGGHFGHMWPESFEQTFVPLSHGGSTSNLASISQAVSKEKKFENV